MNDWLNDMMSRVPPEIREAIQHYRPPTLTRIPKGGVDPSNRCVKIPREHPSECRQCKNYHGQRYGGTLLVCGMHPCGPGYQSCDDFEKSDRSKWVVNVPFSEFTSWGISRFDLSCYNVETGVRVVFSLFAANEEAAVQIAQQILYGNADERCNVTNFVVSYPSPTESQFAAHWAGRSSRYVDATDFRSGTFQRRAVSEELAATLHRAAETFPTIPSSDTAPPTSPEP